jgi:hypothetical protein
MRVKTGVGRASDQIRQSDVILWGGVALGCWALAVLGANLSALVPPNLLAGLHASRLDGGTLNQLRGQVAGLETEAAQLRREAAGLERRMDMSLQQAGNVTQRVGALEITVPRLLEALPRDADIDRSAVTASTGNDGTQRFEAQGGSVMVRQLPLNSAGEPQPLAPLEMPAPLAPMAPMSETVAEVPPEMLGIALGPPVGTEQAAASWGELEARVGTLLIGLSPVLEPAGEDGRGRLIAGPVAGAAEAKALCTHLQMVAVACVPAPYVGEAVPSEN